MKTKILSVLCLLTGIIFIIVDNRTAFLPQIIAKALIMPWLMIIFIINLRHDRNRLHIFMFAGLLFSWIGDILLELTGFNEFMFIAGLAGFLMAHIMYLLVFFSTPGKNALSGRRYYLLIPVLIYGVVFIILIYGGLGEMRLPVIIYAIVMLTMLSCAINRIEKVNRVSFLLVLTGAILFVISDSGIAVSRFIKPFSFSTVFIMSTYVVAQLLITIGYVRQFREEME